jgi:hypothetical protein
MNERIKAGMMDRRNFLKATGVVALGSLAGLSALEWSHRMGAKVIGKLTAMPNKVVQVGFTDGFVSMPVQAQAAPPFFPDPAAPAPFTTFVFGIRDLTPVADPDPTRPATASMFAQKGRAQISAPFLIRTTPFRCLSGARWSTATSRVTREPTCTTATSKTSSTSTWE